MAARKGNCEAIRLLLDHGADVDVFGNEKMTPLQRAIESEPSKEFPSAKLLLGHGTTLEHRSEYGETAIMLAAKRGDTKLVSLLDDAGADLLTEDFASSTCLHHAADSGHLELFVWLVHRGFQLHAKNSLGRSAIYYASRRKEFSSFLLSFGSEFVDMDVMTYTDPGRFMNSGPAWLNEHFSMYLWRLGLERFRSLANLEPANTWSPLCIVASTGQTLAVTNILQLGADLDFEGCPSGSALMAACSSGRLESVKILVRHGAAISYFGKNEIRSAIHSARNHKVILAWLLVDRFTEQRKLAYSTGAESKTHSAGDNRSWSGIVKKELIITGIAERQVHESSRSYWSRLMAVKKGWRGKVVDQNKLAQTHHASRLIPKESVRVCPGDYGTPKSQT